MIHFRYRVSFLSAIWVGGLVFQLMASSGCAGTAPLAQKAVTLNQQGVAAMEAGNLATAEARIALALEYHPKFVDARVNMGLLEMQRGHYDLARVQLERAVKINRHLAQPHHGLGVLCEREGKLQEATEHYLDALSVDPGFYPARANLARIYFEAGQVEQAREQFLRLIQVEPKQVEGWVGLADALFRLGRWREAEQVVKEAKAHVSGAPVLTLYEARIALVHSQVRRARSLLEPLTHDPSNDLAREAWGWLGLSYLIRNDTKKAIFCAEKALRLDRQSALSTFVLAMALQQQKDPDAEAWLVRAARLAPDNPVLRQALSEARSHSNRANSSAL